MSLQFDSSQLPNLLHVTGDDMGPHPYDIYDYSSTHNYLFNVEFEGSDAPKNLVTSIEFSAGNDKSPVRIRFLEDVNLVVSRWVLANLDKRIKFDHVRFDRFGNEISRESFDMAIVKAAPVSACQSIAAETAGWCVLLQR